MTSTSKADLAEAFVASGGLHYSKPQTRRPTIIFTNGYPDADATVQDVVERVERLRRSMEKRRDPPGSWASWLAGQVALHEAEAELRDLGVTP